MRNLFTTKKRLNYKTKQKKLFKLHIKSKNPFILSFFQIRINFKFNFTKYIFYINILKLALLLNNYLKGKK